MTAQIINLNDYRTIPAIVQTWEKREEKIRTSIMQTFVSQPLDLVKRACNEAALAIRSNMSDDEAFEIALLTIKHHYDIERDKERSCKTKF